MGDQEMTLRQWVETLPEIHRARREYEDDQKSLAICDEESKEDFSRIATALELKEENARLRAQVGEVRNKTIDECFKVTAALCRESAGQVYTRSVLEAHEEAFEALKALKPAQGEDSAVTEGE